MAIDTSTFNLEEISMLIHHLILILDNFTATHFRATNITLREREREREREGQKFRGKWRFHLLFQHAITQTLLAQHNFSIWGI